MLACTRCRESHPEVAARLPIIIISAATEEESVVKSLDLGERGARRLPLGLLQGLVALAATAAISCQAVMGAAGTPHMGDQWPAMPSEAVCHVTQALLAPPASLDCMLHGWLQVPWTTSSSPSPAWSSWLASRHASR